MKYVASYLLHLVAHDGAQPTAADLKKILTAAGAEIDEARIKALIEAVGDQDPIALIAAGRSKLQSFGGSAVAAPAAGAFAPAGGAPAKAAEKAPEPEEEEEAPMDFGLFD
jgi:large subunit ribosomal protein LP2